MATVYAVRAVPLRHTSGTIVGWVRVDLLADGTKPTDTVFLRDGTSCGQAESIERIALDPGLLYPSRAEAVDEGIAWLREADRVRRSSPCDP